MKTILWITDGLGWGHDAQSKEISQRLPQYHHEYVFRKRGQYLGGNSWLMEPLDKVRSRITKTKPDIIVAMHPGQIDESFDGINVIWRMGMKSN